MGAWRPMASKQANTVAVERPVGPNGIEFMNRITSHNISRRLSSVASVLHCVSSWPTRPGKHGTRVQAHKAHLVVPLPPPA